MRSEWSGLSFPGGVEIMPPKKIRPRQTDEKDNVNDYPVVEDFKCIWVSSIILAV